MQVLESFAGECVLALRAHGVAGNRAEVTIAFDGLLALPQTPDSSGGLFNLVAGGLTVLQAGVPAERVRTEYFTRLAGHPAGEFVRRHRS